jgi:hypothetical protein
MNEVSKNEQYGRKKAFALAPGDKVRCTINRQVHYVEVLNTFKLSGNSDYVLIQFKEFFPFPIEYEGDQEVTIFIH